MDLASLDTSKPEFATSVMEVKHPGTNKVLRVGPEDDAKPVSITMYGIDSERFREAEQALRNRALKQGRRIKITAEDAEEDAIAILARCTAGWSGIVIDGTEVPFSTESAAKVYRRLRWLREQVDEFIADRANFLKASPTN